jgi:hypothetical protein
LNEGGIIILKTETKNTKLSRKSKDNRTYWVQKFSHYLVPEKNPPNLNLRRRLLRWLRVLVREGDRSGSSVLENREVEEERGRHHCSEHSRNSSHQLSSNSSTLKGQFSVIKLKRKRHNSSEHSRNSSHQLSSNSSTLKGSVVNNLNNDEEETPL